MSEYDKPPLGCAPSYVPASKRIQDLATAIYNHGYSAELNVGHIRKWAKEILRQCDIIEEFYCEESGRHEISIS